MIQPVHLLLVSGSTRHGSTNTAALRTIADFLPEAVTAALFDGLAELPAFNPDDATGEHPAVEQLRDDLAEADVVVFCSPEYAGSLPGSFKNLLDWTVGTGDLYEKPVAALNVAAEGRGVGAADALAVVLGYVGAVMVPGHFMHLPVPRDAVGPEGTVVDAAIRGRIEEFVDSIIESLRTIRRGQGEPG